MKGVGSKIVFWKAAKFIAINVVLVLIVQLSVYFSIDYFQERKKNKIIQAQIYTSEKYHISEVGKVYSKYKIDAFSMGLDDNLLEDYYLLRVRVDNKGVSFNSDFNLILDVGNEYTKIIDIKYKKNHILNRIIQITDDLYNNDFEWYYPENGISYELFWEEYPGKNEFLSGYNIYRSYNENIGFGRVNNEIIKNLSFNVEDFSENHEIPIFYKIVPVGTDGRDFIGDNSFKVRNIIPFKYFRKKDSVASIKEKFSRKKMNSATLNIVGGLPQGANFDVFILCKASNASDFFPKLNFYGPSDVDFKISNFFETYSQEKDEDKKSNMQNIDIMPQNVSIYRHNDLVSLIWCFPENNVDIDGVVIYRSRLRKIGDLSHIGTKIFSGRGTSSNKILFRQGQSKGLFDRKTNNNSDYYINYKEKKTSYVKTSKEILPPVMRGIFNDYAKEDNYYFYLDDNVSLNEAYTYTVYGYSNGKYGPPVVVNASIENLTNVEID